MWLLSFIQSYWKYLISGIVILIIITLGYFWMNTHDSSVRNTERTACNAEWNQKELDRQAAINKANEEAKARKKAIRATGRPSGQSELVRLYRAGSFSQPIQ